MSANEELLAALEASLSALDASSEPALALAAHLAGQHLAAGNNQRALELGAAVLAQRPSDPTVLSITSAAASAIGDVSLANTLRDAQARQIGGSVPADDVAAPPGPMSEPVGPANGWGSDRDGVRLDDVAGMVDVKKRLQREFLAPLANPALAGAFAKNLRGGLLLWGPPGVGKTLIARALAGELGAAFMSAGPADIYGSYFGESEKNVARLFAEARRQAPCVVFLDEIDVLGGRRSKRTTDQARSTTNQLLTELDGIERNSGVYLLAATNAPWDVDPALRRPGRIDRAVVVLPPDPPARLVLLTRLLQDRPTSPGLNLDALVRQTETYTGADLTRIVTTAADYALERSLDAGMVSPISDGDLLRAFRDTHASAKAWFAQASNYVAFADDGEGYSDLRDYLRRHRLG